MRKFTVRILMILCLLTLFVIGVDWLMQTSFRNWIPGGPEQWPGLAYVPEPLHTGMGVASILLPILAGAAFTLLGRGDHIEARSGDGDLIRLTPAAIERVVRRDVMSKVEAVTKTGVRACQGRRRTASVTVNVAVSDRSPVPAVEREVRSVTAESLEQLLGTSTTSTIRVIVFDVQSGRVRKKKPKEAKPEKPAKPAKPVEPKKEKKASVAPALKPPSTSKPADKPIDKPADKLVEKADEAPLDKKLDSLFDEPEKKE
ncbi:hypothetical protein KQI84_04070 [bacterium]|nr:hypothetical protein [bacterium]